MTILEHCDEPTRDSAAQVSHDFAAMVPMAREADYAQLFACPTRQMTEALPTATELADRGCLRPDWRKIRKSFAPQARGEPAGDLRSYYQKAGTLQKALQEGGLVWTTDLGSRGRYVGGGTGETAHGFAVCTWPDGARYEGGYRAGQKHGRGVCTWPNGDRYEGEYKDNKRHGQGVCTWPNGNRYEGAYEDNNRHGQGVCTWAHGDRYEGMWENNNRHGQGVGIDSHGHRYEGAWKDDEPYQPNVAADENQPTGHLAQLMQVLKELTCITA